MPHQINEEFAPRVENKFSKSTVVFKLLRHARSTMPYQITEEFAPRVENKFSK